MTEDVIGESMSTVNVYDPQDPAVEEQRLNLIKDGGRRVMYGGNPYEDDLEPAAPVAGEEVGALDEPVG
jgi:hypothetical protein